MSKKIILAKSGYNALTETDPNKFIFHSDYNTFKIIANGTLTSQTVNASPKTFTLAHGQDITPNFYAFAEFPDGKTALPDSLDYTWKPNVSTGYGAFQLEVDDTNIYFIFSKPGSNYNVNISYYIFEAPL